jgi:dTDP-4-amino-4,6-dideoxygalactose transaminase
MTIPVFVPKLPAVEDLLPYLREIELAQTYSNFGPMVLRLHSELAQYFGVQVNQVVTLANATLALEGAIQTSSNKDTNWLSPSWTYAATNLALARCNVDYEFGDIDQDWRLIVDSSRSAIMDVCPFGDALALERFTNPNQTILVDAAASFPALKGCGQVISNHDGPVGIVVSFHPTKVVPGVEGGVFISNKPEWVEQVAQWSRFGMKSGSRASIQIGTNAKMNEYQAAMILASMKYFETLRKDWIELHDKAKQISSSLGLSTHPAMSKGEISSYWVIETSPDLTDLIETTFLKNGYQTRRWWEYGCHQMPFFKKDNSISLPVTDRVASSSIALPFHLYLCDEDLERIHKAIDQLL